LRTTSVPWPPGCAGQTPPTSFAVTKAAVLEWAILGLRSVCPLTAALLEIDGRFATEVAAQLDAGQRPMSLHLWGRTFSRRMLADGDPLVADVARLELITLGDPDAARTAPDPWLWWRPPEQVIVDLLTGVDPRRRRPDPKPCRVAHTR
jgi:hypothetical protein